MKICPVCNTMIDSIFHCSKCGGELMHEGRVEEFLGPYSADTPIENSLYCSHTYKCVNCSNMENLKIKMINY